MPPPLVAALHTLRSTLHGFRPLGPWRFSEPERVVTLELRQRLPLITWLIAVAWYLAAPSAVAAVTAFALTGWLAIAWLWARTLARGVSAERRLHYAAVQVGDTLEEHLTLNNNTRLPVLWAEFVDRSDLPGYTVSSVQAADPWNTARWRARAVCDRRGLFQLGPWELLMGDPLGMFRVRQVYLDRQELLVYPPLAPLPPQLRPHSTTTTGEHRRLRRPAPVETLSALTARHYVPGDPLHHIHWPTSARRGQLYAKVFEPESSAVVWLVPDLDPAVHLGDGADSTEETMMLLLASVAADLLRRRLAVGLLAWAESVVAVRPQFGQPHQWALMRALAPLHPVSPLALPAALARLSATVSPRDRLIVVTPSLDAGWPAALRNRPGGGGVEAILLDPASFGGHGDVEAARRTLAAQGVPAQTLRRGDLAPEAGAYGALRRWEFITLGTGRAVARQTPRPSGLPAAYG
jgi:uncharacterized protein (DUF58 family)